MTARRPLCLVAVFTLMACSSTTTGDLLAKGPGEPLTQSTLIGFDLRIEHLPCVERIIIQLHGSGEFPGWAVEYLDDPVPLGMSGDTTYLEGDATGLDTAVPFTATVLHDPARPKLDLPR